jgi:hypothetical protein
LRRAPAAWSLTLWPITPHRCGSTPRTALCEADLAAVAGAAYGIRIPKVEYANDVAWVAERAPGTPLICAIESARGVLSAAVIAAVPEIGHLAMGGVDLARDLKAGSGNLQTLYMRSHLVVASRAAGIEPPIDSVYAHLDDETGLREQAEFARSLGSSASPRSTHGSDQGQWRAGGVLVVTGLSAVLCPLAGAAISRRAELAATRFAASDGLAQELATALQTIEDGRPPAVPGWSRRLLSSHPPAGQRITVLGTARASTHP